MIDNKTKVKELIRKADYCLELADWKGAEKYLQEAISLDPTNPEAFYLLGEALCKQERFLESIHSLKIANKILPNNPRILHLLGWANFMSGNAALGRKFMTKALQLLPEDIQILCDLAVLENKEGNEIQAKKHVLKALKIDPKNEMAKEVLQSILFFSRLRRKLSENDKIN